jgi:hydroxypyruvate reductase
MKADSTMLRFAEHALHADGIVEDVLDAANPAACVERFWPTGLPPTQKIKLLAVGKASIEMALAACAIVSKVDGCHPFAGGLVTAVPSRMTSDAPRDLAKFNIRALPADHPLPTQRNVIAAKEVEAFLRACTPDETLLVLLSGGGSAHLALPAPGLSLNDLKVVSSALMRSGATISELNTVRKHLELLKGGRCAKLSRAGHTRVLVLSDVIGDRLDVISSGPFAPDPTTFGDALKVIEERKVDAPPSVLSVLNAGLRGESNSLGETPKPGDRAFERVQHTILASNAITAKAVGAQLEKSCVHVEGVRVNVEGEAATVANEWLLDCIGRTERSVRSGPVAFLLGGETTVTVGAATGLGGPSQEFALVGARALAMYRAAHPNSSTRFALVTFSTDGFDGPTNAAGAVVTDETWHEIRKIRIDPDRALKNHDSHNALESVNALIRTGATGTNVNHIAVLLMYPA